MADQWTLVLNSLGVGTPQLRCEAIDKLTELLQKNDWRLPDGRGEDLISRLRDRLSDSNWSVTQRCLLLVGDLVAELEDLQVDELVRAHLLPGLVAKVSDSKVVVRKAASQVRAREKNLRDARGARFAPCSHRRAPAFCPITSAAISLPADCMHAC